MGANGICPVRAAYGYPEPAYPGMEGSVPEPVYPGTEGIVPEPAYPGMEGIVPGPGWRPLFERAFVSVCAYAYSFA